MITNFILYALYSIVNAIFNSLFGAADVTLDAGIGGALASIGGYLNIVTAVIPIEILLGAFVGVHLIVEGYIFAYKAIMWVVRRLPTQS